MADASLGTATLRARLDASGLRVGLDQAKAETTRAIQAIDQRLAGLGRSFQRIGTGLTVGITAPLTALGVVGVRSAMQLETFAASLNVLVGDTERANAVFEELYEFSANTPFDWRSLTEGTRTLAAFQIEAERIVPTLSRIGDVAAGLQVPINDLAQIYGRVHVTGRLGMEEVNRLADRGVPIYTELAKQLGVTEVAVRDLVSAGKVGFPELESVFANLTNEGGMFFGMMDAQADTVQGRLNRLKDSFEQVTDVVGERLLPTFDKLVSAGQKATEWFVNLDESTQGLLVGLGVTLAATGPVLVGVGTLLVQIPKLVAGFTTLRTVMLPFLGPMGVLLGAAAGYAALSSAMNAGAQQRQQAAQDFRSLVESMGAYRDQLVITSEEERKQLEASLERRKQALERVLQMQQAMVRGIEAEVIAFANMPWYQQLFNFGAANVNLDALDKAEDGLRGVQQELAAVNTQLDQVSTLEITPNVTAPPPIDVSLNVSFDGDGGELLADPAEAAKRWVARLSAELRFGLKGPAEVIDLLSPRVDALRNEAANALSEFGIDSQQYQDTLAKLDAVEGVLDRIRSGSTIQLAGSATAEVTAARPVGVTPFAEVDLAGVRSIAMIEEDLSAARARVRAAATNEARAEAVAVVMYLEEELLRLTRGVALAIAPVAEIVGEARTLVGFSPTAAVAGARPVGIAPVAEVTGEFSSVAQIEAELASARRTVRTAATREARQEAQLVVMELERELERLKRQITPVALAITPRAEVLEPPTPRALGIAPTATIDGMDPAEWVRAQERAAADQQRAADQFASTVVSAGFAMGDAAIRAIQDGDIPGLLKAGLSGAGSILGAAQFDPISLFGGMINPGVLIAGGLGLLGTLLGALLGGGRRDVDESRRAAGAAVQSAPAIDLRVIINQSLNVQSLTDPASRRAVDGLLDDMVRRVEDTLKRNVLPRLDALEGAA